jgi:hypothetical protein
MRYKVKFSKGWQGTWMFTSINDMRAWETVKNYIKEHTQAIIVDIDEIWEIDESGNNIRKLENYISYFTPYKVNYTNGECVLNIYKEKDDVLVWNEVKRIVKKEYDCDINWIEELNKINKNTIRRLGSYKDCVKIKNNSKKQLAKGENTENEDTEEEINIEKAIYKAYFSDGECSGPYIANISEDDIIALNIAKFKLKQHAEYNGISINKIIITKVEELNENKLFEVNLIRKKEKKNRILNIKECS